MRPLGALLLTAWILLGAAPIASAQTVWVVDPGGQGDFTTLQGCIDDPCVLDGHVCRAVPGTYRENVRFRGKAITLSGAGGPEETIIDGGGNGSTVSFQSGEGPDSILEGFTVRNGSGTWVEYLCLGGGIFVSGASPEIRDCVVTGNTVSVDDFFALGGGIASLYASPVMTRCTVRDNETRGVGAKGTGGGGLFIMGGNPILTACRIEDNRCLYGDETLGGGIACLTASPTLVNSFIARNLASGDGVFVGGGGLFLSNAAPLLLHCTFTGNRVDGGGTYEIGGGLLLVESSAPRIQNSILWADSAPFGPELFVLDDSAPEVRYSNVQMEAGDDVWPGEGNLNGFPFFSPAGDGRLTGVSPCVDRGDNVSSGALSTDLDGRQRRVDGDCDNESVVDMGACEFQRLCPWPSASVLGTGAGPWEHTRITARVNSLLLPALLPALLLVRRLLRNGDRKPR